MAHCGINLKDPSTNPAGCQDFLFLPLNVAKYLGAAKSDECCGPDTNRVVEVTLVGKMHFDMIMTEQLTPATLSLGTKERTNELF